MTVWRLTMESAETRPDTPDTMAPAPPLICKAEEDDTSPAEEACRRAEIACGYRLTIPERQGRQGCSNFEVAKVACAWHVVRVCQQLDEAAKSQVHIQSSNLSRKTHLEDLVPCLGRPGRKSFTHTLCAQ